MKRKMALLEQAHGLLCNTPSDGTSAEEGDLWRNKRAEWIDRWTHVIRDHATKHHNKRIRIGNEAITDYQHKADRSRRNAEEIRTLLLDTPATASDVFPQPTNWRVVGCDDHGVRALNLNGKHFMCEDCRVLGPDGQALGADDGCPQDGAA